MGTGESSHFFKNPARQRKVGPAEGLDDAFKLTQNLGLDPPSRQSRRHQRDRRQGDDLNREKRNEDLVPDRSSHQFAFDS